MGWRENWSIRAFGSGGRTQSVFLDGAISWRVQSRQPWQYQPLASIPVGTEIVVEVVPQRNGVIMLNYEGKGVANFYDGLYSKSLHGAVSQARKKGYRVLAHAKKIRPGQGRRENDLNPNPSDSHLEVRSTLSADLFYWLASSPESRAKGYYELDWDEIYEYLPGTEGYVQQLSQLALLGHVHSRIVHCQFVVAGRTKSGKPKVFDVVAHGKSIGRVSAYRHLDDTSYGFARIQRRWSPVEDQYVIEAEICAVRPNGNFPINTYPFEWQDQRRGWH